MIGKKAHRSGCLVSRTALLQMNRFFSSLLFVALLSQGCSKASSPDLPVKADTGVVKPPLDPVLPKATYDLGLLSKSAVFDEQPSVTVLANQVRAELSGIAASGKYPGVLFVHEDSGNYNEVYVTNTKGDDLGKIVLDGVVNRDWEDIAYGPGPESGKNYLYVADIGDNDAIYPSVTVYRFAEPDLAGAGSSTVKHVTPEKLVFTYPKGSVNAESLLLDPLKKDLYLATKEASKSTLFVARFPQSTGSTTVLTPLATFSFDLLTAGDISADGSEILLRNTGQIWYWKRVTGESVATTLLRAPQDAPYTRNEHQGEAVGFAADGSGYLTTSETKKFPGDRSSVSFYKRK